MEVCDSEAVAHPKIVSEGGRAIVAHHSVLVVEAFGSIEKDLGPTKIEAAANDPKQLRDIIELKRLLKRGNRIESLHDSQQIKEETQQLFNLGLLDLESKAKIEAIYWQLARQIVALHRGLKYVPEEVKELETSLGDQYLCNFSIFQSLLDHWALGQLFPIMPIHRLTTPPERQGTLVDITCDSDGKINKFTDLQDVKDTLPLHAISPGELYYLGVFLVGAYQDIMGDLHNLFGRVTEVHVFLDEDEESGWYIEEVIEGSTIGQVLALTQWDKIELMRLVKMQVDAAIKSDRLKPNDAMKILADYERGLMGYTYLSLEGAATAGASNGASAPPRLDALTQATARHKADSQRVTRGEIRRIAKPTFSCLRGTIIFLGRLERLFQPYHVFARAETVERFRFFPQFLFGIIRRLDRKTDASLDFVDFDHARFDFLAHLKDVFHFRDVVLAQLRDMDEPVDVVLQLHEGAEAGQLGDLAVTKSPILYFSSIFFQGSSLSCLMPRLMR